MPRKNNRNTKGRIISAAWKLFYDQGYEETTIEDIIFESQTSRGSFYHYFNGKSDLMGTLAYVFDEKYEELKPQLGLGAASDAVGKLIFLNHELFQMIEHSISREILSRLLSTQLTAHGEKHLLDRNRTYFRLLRQIVRDGIAAREFREGLTEQDLVDIYAFWERALLYDWCLNDGEYSLVAHTDRMTPAFLRSYCRN